MPHLARRVENRDTLPGWRGTFHRDACGCTMKKPKKTAWEETVKPEPPGLWMVKFGGGFYSDKELVEKAEKHLLELLKNPYYDEAYQQLRLNRQLPPGRSDFPQRKGALARDLQTLVANPSKPAHRPRKDNVALAYLARYFKDHPKMNKTEFCRELVRSHKKLIQRRRWPKVRNSEKLAEKLRKAVSNYQRGR